MKNLVLVVACLFVSTSAFASEIDGEWVMEKVTCSGGTSLDLGGTTVGMSVNATQISVSMAIADLPGCVLRQVSTYQALAGKLQMNPIANSATEACGEDFSIDMTPAAYDYALGSSTLQLTSLSAGEGGCPDGETETTVLVRR